MPSAEVVAHHLRLCGVAAQLLDASGSTSQPAAIQLALRPTGTDAASLRALAMAGHTVLAILAAEEFLASFQVSEQNSSQFTATLDPDTPSLVSKVRLRSLHPMRGYAHPNGSALLRDPGGRAIWLQVPIGKGHVIFIGSDIGRDLIRYRQGDPAQAASVTTQQLWGIAGERPNYLFEAQIPPECEDERQADWWSMALAEVVSACRKETLSPLLPGGAPGCVVITGDDDQAYLEKYQEQLDVLSGLPITYFLHPETRHTAKSLKQMRQKYPVEFGIHPDALRTPEKYAEVYRQQAIWYKKITGEEANSVRNHGYLNDGYWGHLPIWLEHGVTISANLPGLNGKVLNGSLLPARLVAGSQLSDHWSILTAIGDGVRFALNMDGPQSAQCVHRLADRIRDSRLPGVIVLNLHPQNVSEAREMHVAVRDIVEAGFLPMQLSECIGWFAHRDHPQKPRSRPMRASSLYERARSLLGLRG